MITINTAKGPFKVESWDDVLERPGFTIDLDPKEHQLDAVIGRYTFSDMIKCGLSNCHTLHARGYIVATKNGRETNIGKDCGKKYFALDFDQMARQFDSDMAAYENRDLLWSFSFRLDELEARIADLRSDVKGADWVHKHAQALIVPGKLPLVVTRKMNELVKQRSGKWTQEREATPQEVEEIEVRTGRKPQWPLYVTDFEVNIDGIEALYEENNLRTLLIFQVLDELKTFKGLSIDELTKPQLTRWKKWANSVDLSMERAVDSIEQGRRLLTKENLAPLLRVDGIEKNGEDERFMAYLEQLG